MQFDIASFILGVIAAPFFWIAGLTAIAIFVGIKDKRKAAMQDHD